MSYALALANPGSDIDKYLSQVYSIPVLTREEELDLTREFYDTEDIKVAHKLVISHLRFVVHIAKSYAGYGLPLADVIQEGNLGLIKDEKPIFGAIYIPIKKTFIVGGIDFKAFSEKNGEKRS